MRQIVVKTKKSDVLISRLNDLGPELCTPVPGKKDTYAINTTSGSVQDLIADLDREKVLKIVSVTA